MTDIFGKLLPILNCGRYHAISVWSRTSVPQHSLRANEARLANKAKRRQNTNPIYFSLYVYFFEKTVKSAAARLESHFHEFAFFFFLQSHLHVRPPATFAVKVLQLEHLVSDRDHFLGLKPLVSDHLMHSLISTLCPLYALYQKAVVCLVPHTIWHLPPDWFAPLRWLTLLIWLRRQRRGRKLGSPYPEYCGYSPWSFQRRLCQLDRGQGPHPQGTVLSYLQWSDRPRDISWQGTATGKRLKLRGFKDTTDELKSLLTAFFEFG